jgi:hypothetical protein
MRREIVGVEDGDASLEGRGDSVFERHDDDGWRERSVEKRKTENKRRNARIESEAGRQIDRCAATLFSKSCSSARGGAAIC